MLSKPQPDRFSLDRHHQYLGNSRRDRFAKLNSLDLSESTVAESRMPACRRRARRRISLERGGCGQSVRRRSLGRVANGYYLDLE